MRTVGRTVGVEEEFLLLRPDGEVAPVADRILPLSVDVGTVTQELMRYQIETSSGVCDDLGELERQLAALRRQVRDAAARQGALLVACGAPPLGDGGLDLLTDGDRYRQLAARFRMATAVSGTCACHVHVGIDDRELAVDVLARLRPWLPALLALWGNSPLQGGLDTGWASMRYRRQLSWPTFRPPHPHRSVAEYDEHVRQLLHRGAALDARSVYFLARLSPRYPTLEVRVADVCLAVEDAGLLAGLVRGLVESLALQLGSGRDVPPANTVLLRRRLLQAAHEGPVGIQGRHGARRGRGRCAEELLAAARLGLAEAGDTDRVTAGLERLTREGTGAERQRRLRAESATDEHFVAALARATVPESGEALQGGYAGATAERGAAR